MSGAIYELQADGSIKVEHRRRIGRFHPDGRHHSGELKQADLHLLGWIGGKQLSRGPWRVDK
jgi:hypothetical protein